MIVRSAPAGVQLITQPDHARLARTIMEHCVPLANNPRRHVILRAIAEHDNGWTEEDASPTVNPDTGEIVDFVNAPLAVRHSVWPRGVARLSDDPWAAALVAQHAVTVYERFRQDGAWAPFFAGMEHTRDRLLRSADVPAGFLATDYAFVRLGDLISLTFCTGWTDEQRFGEWTIHRDGHRIVVEPDAFSGASIPFRIFAKQLEGERFESNEVLRHALRRATAVALEGAVAGRRSLPGA
jgi:hypothetical protein